MSRTKRIAVTAVALCLVAVTFSGAGLAASNGSITADPAEPGTTATHTVTVTVDEASAGTWNGLAVDYGDSGTDVGAVTQGDLVRIGVDEGADDPDDAIDREVGMSVESVSASDDASRLTVSLDGSTEIEAGDELVVVYENVTNPESEGMDGGWEVGLDVDPESSGGETTASLSLGGSMDDDSMNDSESMDDDSMNDSESMDDDSMNDSESMDDDGTGVSQPGFGVLVALVALVGAGLLVVRRRR